MGNNKLVVAIVVWNNHDDAINCAKSLLQQTIADQLTVLFVDNASNTTTVNEINDFTLEHTDSVYVTHTGMNGGTAGGFTAAAKWAKEHGYLYVGALNADATADPLWCERLLEQLEADPNAGIATGAVLHADGKTIDSSGDFYTTWGLPAPRGRNAPVSDLPSAPEYIFGATGGAYVCKTAIYDTVGYYDEKMFMYYEDVDFSYRAQLCGFKVRYTPQAVVYHKRGASSDTVPGLAIYNTFKNLPILFIKDVPLGLMPTIWLRFTLAYFLILGNAIVHGNGKYALTGWLKKFTLIPHALRERKRIQSTRKVSDEYIRSIILHDIPPEQTGMRKFRAFFTGKN